MKQFYVAQIVQLPYFKPHKTSSSVKFQSVSHSQSLESRVTPWIKNTISLSNQVNIVKEKRLEAE